MFDLSTNNTVVLKNTEILLIKEFKTLWEADSDKTKTIALKEFAYIYFKNDFNSPYRKSHSLEELPKVLKKDLLLPNTWKPSKEIIAAEKKYTTLQTTKSLKVLMAAEMALEQVKEYFATFSLKKLDTDKKADAISKLMNNLKAIDDVVGKLEAAKRRVAAELENTKKLSGNKQLSSRELPKNKRN